MKGLLLKDFYMITKYCKSIFIIVAVFMLAGVSNPTSYFYTIYPVIVASIIPMTIMSYDERFKWNLYCDCMPFSRKKAVASKYILMLLIISITIILISITQVISQIKNSTFELTSYITLITSSFSMTIIAQSFILPIIFKLGVEKGRIAYFIIIGIMCGGGIAAYTIFNEETTIKLNIISNISSYITSPIIILLVSAILFVCSFLLSARFYKNREL